MDYTPAARYKLIYVFAIDDDDHNGYLKIGKASLNSFKSESQLLPNCEELNEAAHSRIKNETRTAYIRYELLYTELAVRHITMADGSDRQDDFEDTDVHEILKNSGFRPLIFRESGKDSEWYPVGLTTIKKAINAYKSNLLVLPKEEVDDNNIVCKKMPQRTITLRDEQNRNVEQTINVFKTQNKMLWDCKMRYGKTVTAYELIKREGYKRVIVVTHRPAVEDSWDTDHDLMFFGTNHRFVDKSKGQINGYEEVMDSNNDKLLHDLVQQDIPFTYFASIQDLRDSKVVGGRYNKNNGVYSTDWELLIVDEAHEGTQTDLGEAVLSQLEGPNTKVLSLTGTAYGLRKKYGDNVFTWTYVDEQKAKQEWKEIHPDEKNPYADLPVMNILTFDISEKIQDSYKYVTADSAFNFREFFRTWTGEIDRDYYPIPHGKYIGDFVHEDAVWSFLNLISKEDKTNNYPFSNNDYRDMFAHTFWIVPGVKEAKALSKMLKNHPVFGEYDIVNVAGDGDEEERYDLALNKVRKAIKEHDRTITLSCGRLTTGITVREWTAIMMLSGSSTTSVNGYMQAIFRVQSPGVIKGKRKENCYVFDFAPDRALKVIGEIHRLSAKMSRGEDEKERRALGEFLNFCPVIAVEGTKMLYYDVPDLMRQIKKISVESAINSGFDDNTIYLNDAGLSRSKFDLEILSKLADVIAPKKRTQNNKTVIISGNGLTNEERENLEKIHKKNKKVLTEEEKRLLEKEKKEKREQQKLFDLLRAVSIRLPLLFYGAEADITELVDLDYFVDKVDDESWMEFMPKGLRKDLFKEIIRYYDKDVLIGAGLRIRQLAKAADEYPPTVRAMKIVEIISKFKNPDKETVLTPWKVVNMHLGETLGGYNFYDEHFEHELDEPRFIECERTTEDILLNNDVKVLELNSKSGLYPLYMAYSIYKFKLMGKEKDNSKEVVDRLWNEILEKNIFVLCKTRMARSITVRTLSGYTNKKVNAIFLTKLVEERMKDLDRLSRKLTNPETWGTGGERMKFDAVIGNPPYQGSNHQQIYTDFYLTARKLGKYVTLIFPTGWQQPKSGNSLNKLNNPEIKADKQIVYIDNKQNVFPGISGAEWVNIILWERGYDNGLNGKQRIYTNRENPEEIQLLWNKQEIVKPEEIVQLAKKVSETLYFESVAKKTSVRKPYGLSTDVFSDYEKYNLKPFEDDKHSITDITILGGKEKKYISRDYDLPKKTNAFNKFKVFVPYAWGNMSEQNGLGGAFADIYVAKPYEICTETFLESGCFETYQEAYHHAKFLMTKFARALLYMNKTSQHSTTAWGAVPLLTYSESWWNLSISEIDDKLFDKYDIPINIREYVKNNIQTKDESNIKEIQ